MSDLAIIIVNWNVRALLANCLLSVQADLQRSGLTGEIWVVDNASADGSAEMVRCHFPGIKLIASTVNLGFAGGNNAALQAMGFSQTGELTKPRQLPKAILLLNPDTLVHPGGLRHLTEFLRCTPRAGIAGAQLVYGDGSFQHGAFAFPGLWQLAIELLPLPGRLVESRLNGRYPRTLYRQGQPFPIGHPLGAAMCVRSQAIRQVGLLDEQYHMYVEEVDWSKRITAAGWQAFCVPKAIVTHLGGQSTGQAKMSSLIDLWRSRYRFYKKHYAPLKVWLARQIVQIGMNRRARANGTTRASTAPAALAERQQGYQRVINIWQDKER